MTWLHCHPDDGSIVTCSTDQDFNESNASSQMKCNFVNIHTDMTIEEARLYHQPLFQQLETEIEGQYRNGELLQKRQWQIDLNAFVPPEHQDKISDRGQEVPLVHELESRRVVTEHGIEKCCVNADDITKIAR